MIPPLYTPASLRCVLPYDPKRNGIGIGFDVGGDQVRVFLSCEDSDALLAWLLLMLNDRGAVPPAGGRHDAPGAIRFHPPNGKGRSITPPIYAPARLHDMRPDVSRRNRVLLGFDMGGDPVRLCLSIEDAGQLLAGLAQYLGARAVISQSSGSSGSPNCAGSPIDGQIVAPDARSSIAERGDE